MLEKLIADFEKEGMLTGHTFISMISEMTCLSESIRSVCKNNYHNIQLVYQNKLIADGYSQESAHSIAIMMIVTIEGGNYDVFNTKFLASFASDCARVTKYVKKLFS